MVPVPEKELTVSKKHALISQVFMTFIMAAMMSGLLGLIFSGGFSMDWLTTWPKQFIVAWPIAFLLTMVAWPASVSMAAKFAYPAEKKAA